jgi:arylsulfatase A-like enzyme
LKPLDATFPTLAEILRSHGYETAGFVANVYYATAETGLGRGFDVWKDYRWSPREVLLSAGAMQWLVVGWKAGGVLPRHDPKRATEVTDDFLSWLDEQPRRRFFGFLNYFDAHVPAYAPPGIVGRFGSPSQAGLTQLGRDRVAKYDAAIAFLDTELERLTAGLEARGLLRQTWWS